MRRMWIISKIVKLNKKKAYQATKDLVGSRKERKAKVQELLIIQL